MPNHHLNQKGELQGFYFHTSAYSKAKCLPIGNETFRMHVVYDLTGQQARGTFHKKIMNVLSKRDILTAQIKSFMCELSSNAVEADNVHEADFSCVPTCSGVHMWNTLHGELQDARAWTDECPEQCGVYHCIWRDPNSKENVHKLFLALTVNLRKASEELQNLWQDVNNFLTAEEFVMSEEVQWLRQATLRSSNRVAYRLASKLGIATEQTSYRDVQDPNKAMALIPTTFTCENDLLVEDGLVHVTNHAAVMNSGSNGIVFRHCPSEGYYIFKGASDKSDLSFEFGTVWSSKTTAFPSSTIEYSKTFPPMQGNTNITTENNKTFFFPDASFMSTLETLGWNNNNGFVTLMPISMQARTDLQ